MRPLKRSVIHYRGDVKMGKNVDDLLEALDILWNSFNNCRAHFPYIPDNAVGIITVANKCTNYAA